MQQALHGGGVDGEPEEDAGSGRMGKGKARGRGAGKKASGSPRPQRRVEEVSPQEQRDRESDEEFELLINEAWDGPEKKKAKQPVSVKPPPRLLSGGRRATPLHLQYSLPSALRRKAARQGGVKRIPLVRYLGSRNLALGPVKSHWVRQVEEVATAAQLAYCARILDRWIDHEAVRRKQPVPEDPSCTWSITQLRTGPAGREFLVRWRTLAPTSGPSSGPAVGEAGSPDVAEEEHEWRLEDQVDFPAARDFLKRRQDALNKEQVRRRQQARAHESAQRSAEAARRQRGKDEARSRLLQCNGEFHRHLATYERDFEKKVRSCFARFLDAAFGRHGRRAKAFLAREEKRFEMALLDKRIRTGEARAAQGRAKLNQFYEGFAKTQGELKRGLEDKFMRLQAAGANNEAAKADFLRCQAEANATLDPLKAQGEQWASQAAEVDTKLGSLRTQRVATEAAFKQLEEHCRREAPQAGQLEAPAGQAAAGLAHEAAQELREVRRRGLVALHASVQRFRHLVAGLSDVGLDPAEASQGDWRAAPEYHHIERVVHSQLCQKEAVVLARVPPTLLTKAKQDRLTLLRASVPFAYRRHMLDTYSALHQQEERRRAKEREAREAEERRRRAEQERKDAHRRQQEEKTRSMDAWFGPVEKPVASGISDFDSLLHAVRASDPGALPLAPDSFDDSEAASPKTQPARRGSKKGVVDSKARKQQRQEQQAELKLRKQRCMDLQKQRTAAGVMCVCGSPNAADARPMIFCEHCKGWFHCACIDVNAYTAPKFRRYACPACVAAGVRIVAADLGGPLPESIVDQVIRTWLEEVQPLRHGDPTPPRWRSNAFLPQVGDRAVYFPRLHRQYLTVYPDLRRPDRPKQLRQLPWQQKTTAGEDGTRAKAKPVPSRIPCLVQDVYFEFPDLSQEAIPEAPHAAASADSAAADPLLLQCVVVLEPVVADVASDERLDAFAVVYRPFPVGEAPWNRVGITAFLHLEAALQERCSKLRPGLQCKLPLRSCAEARPLTPAGCAHGTIEKVPDGDAGRLGLHAIEVRLRKKGAEGATEGPAATGEKPSAEGPLVHVSAWDLEDVVEAAAAGGAEEALLEPVGLPPGVRAAIFKVLQKYAVLDDCWEFVAPLVTDNAPGYLGLVPLPLCLNDVSDRLVRNFGYRTPQAILGDVRLVLRNCLAYNGSESELSARCSDMVKGVDADLQRLFQSIRAKPLPEPSCIRVLKITRPSTPPEADPSDAPSNPRASEVQERAAAAAREAAERGLKRRVRDVADLRLVVDAKRRKVRIRGHLVDLLYGQEAYARTGACRDAPGVALALRSQEPLEGQAGQPGLSGPPREAGRREVRSVRVRVRDRTADKGLMTEALGENYHRVGLGADVDDLGDFLEGLEH